MFNILHLGFYRPYIHGYVKPTMAMNVQMKCPNTVVWEKKKKCFELYSSLECGPSCWLGNYLNSVFYMSLAYVDFVPDVSPMQLYPVQFMDKLTNFWSIQLKISRYSGFLTKEN